MKSYWYLITLVLFIALAEYLNLFTQNFQSIDRGPSATKVSELRTLFFKRDYQTVDILPIIARGLKENIALFKEEGEIDIDFITIISDVGTIPLYRIEFIIERESSASYHEVLIRTNGHIFIIDDEMKKNNKTQVVWKRDEEYQSIDEKEFILEILPEKSTINKSHYDDRFTVAISHGERTIHQSDLIHFFRTKKIDLSLENTTIYVKALDKESEEKLKSGFQAIDSSEESLKQ